MVDVICHYESDDVKTFINEQFGIKSEFNPPITEEYYKPFLGKTEIQLINKIYERDFAVFNYEKR